jgi:acyl-CoA thioester hydrolase
MRFGESRLQLPVRPNDIDGLGHVNNAVVLEYLEAARWDWLARQGLVPGDRMIAVVTRAEIDYHAEIPPGQVEVRTVLESPTADELDDDLIIYRARLRQRVYLPAAPKPAASGLITVAFLDAAARRPVSMQDFLAASVPGVSR